MPELTYNIWNEYENFDISFGYALGWIVAGLFIGAALAAAATLYSKRYLGGLVRDLIRAGALSPESAKTLPQLGRKGSSPFMRFSLRAASTFRKTVRSENAGDKLPELSSARFYIPEEQRYRAETRYRRKGTDGVSLIFALILLALCAALVIFLTPELLTMLDNLITQIKG